MLRHLYIRDLVLVRELELTFAGGMSVLTGETGAGKSILIDALGLVLGGRSDTGLIHHQSERAEIAASFDVSACAPVLTWLRERELDADDDCLLRRTLPRTGRSRAFINGTPATLADLAAVGALLVEIHGQHAHQTLMRANAQRALLDAYAGHRDLVTATADAFQKLRGAREALARVANLDENRLDYVEFQLGEMSSHDLDPDHIGRLESEQRRLANAEALQQRCAALHQLLYDGDDAVDQAVARAANEIGELARLDTRLEDAGALLREAGMQITEAAGRLRACAEETEAGPEALAEVERELGALHDLARKHRVSMTELSQVRDRLDAERQDLLDADAQRQSLTTEIDALSTVYRDAAAALTASRREAAARLGAQVTESMQELGMRGGQFSVCVAARDNPGESPSGLDAIVFEVAANPGQPLSALADTASGGELSRIGLAVQVAGNELGAVPTLVFDEVDAGIGGAVAEIVGQLMRRLGRQRQVLCVTHLAQVAAQAHHHFRVAKRKSKKQTETTVDDLDEGSRVDEIARMLGGRDISARTLAYADEMLQRNRGGNTD